MQLSPRAPAAGLPAAPALLDQADPDEYRAITRHLLHQGGQVHYTATRITVTLDRPDSPRVARALQLLTDELNVTPASIPGDRRTLTYKISEA